jgi:hypothetical protein
MNLRTRRIYEAQRAGVIARLHDDGIPANRADALFGAWENEAVRRGISRLTPGFWSSGADWIHAEFERRPRSG